MHSCLSHLKQAWDLWQKVSQVKREGKREGEEEIEERVRERELERREKFDKKSRGREGREE